MRKLTPPEKIKFLGMNKDIIGYLKAIKFHSSGPLFETITNNKELSLQIRIFIEKALLDKLIVLERRLNLPEKTEY